MSVIKVDLPLGEVPVMGKQVSFKAPCDCTVTEAVQIDGVNYTVCDALGRCVTGEGGVWAAGEIISVILNPEDQKAYIQNGNLVHVATGSYVGTGTSQNNGEVTLTFDFAPKVLMLFGANGTILAGRNTDYTYSADSSLAIGYPQALTTSFARGLFVNDYGVSGGGSGNILAKRSDDGKSVTWKTTAVYEDEDGSLYYYPAQGYNAQGVTYYYVAIG